MDHGEKKAAELSWREREENLELDGDVVLRCRLNRPDLKGGGRGPGRIRRCYEDMERRWLERWRKELYLSACLELAGRRQEGRTFTPWSASLAGEVTLQEENLLSLRMTAEEIRGDGRSCLVVWGDVWRLREGSPLPLSALLPGRRAGRRRLLEAMLRQGRERRKAGDCFLDQDWESRLPRLVPWEDFWLTEEELHFAFPQCAIGPAAEGAIVFHLPRPDRPPEEGPEEAFKSA